MLYLHVELLLKTILQKHDLLRNEHNLLGLFNYLPKDAKNEIISLDDCGTFIKELSSISCLFEEWRYIYEYYLSSINLSFLLESANRLYIYTAELLFT